MQFMIIRRADADTERGALPTAELMAAMGRYMEEMGNAGILRGGNGLHPSAKGVRIAFSGGRPTVIDGPFAETKELIAGFHIIDVPSMAEAIEWTRRWPPEDGGGALQLEIRPIIAPEDFGPEFTAEMLAARVHLDRER